jgi:predicted O-methyltransferase YrrM
VSGTGRGAAEVKVKGVAGQARRPHHPRMDDTPSRFPASLPALRVAARDANFSMSCDERTGSLLSVLAAARPGARILELGTGVGEGTAWLLSGMDSAAHLVTIELDEAMQKVAREQLGPDPRVTFVAGDGGEWLQNYAGKPFDLVFADTWPGKFTHLEEALQLVTLGGTYLIDDLDPQPGWQEEHGASVKRLLTDLEEREDFRSVRIAWASGLFMAVRSARP